MRYIISANAAFVVCNGGAELDTQVRALLVMGIIPDSIRVLLSENGDSESTIVQPVA